MSAWIGSAGLLVFGSLASPGFALDNENYGYVRSIEGYSDLIQNGSNEVVKLTANYPIIVGDKIRVSERARIETVLPDGSYLRLGNSTDLEFQKLTRSADTHGESTLLLLHQGEAQLVTHTNSSSPQAFRIDTSNATIYIRDRGRYRVFADGTSWTEISVRQGYADVVTESGSSVVQSGESLFVEGVRDPVLSLQAATQLSSLELWGEQLSRTADRYGSEHVDPSLAYSSTALYRHGSWMLSDSGYAWRPRVSPGWRPYHSGWWAHTPSGLTWVSTDPWGWLTHHYGVWDYGPSYGWMWHPGRHYTPAAVYWYWGPTHVGWIPAGYYTRYYGHRYPRYLDPYAGRHYNSPYLWRPYGRGGLSVYGSGAGFHIGVLGTAGGNAAHWKDWTFTRHHRLGHRGGHAYLRTGAQLYNQGTFQRAVPSGLIATDTRSLTPDLWQQPSRAMEALRDRPGRTAVGRTSIEARNDLPDLGPWVARRRDLPERVARTMIPSVSGGSEPTSSRASIGVGVSGSNHRDRPTGQVLTPPRSPDRRSITETWRLGGVSESPGRRWGSDLRQRRQSRQPVISNPTRYPSWAERRGGTGTADRPVILPLWEDVRSNRQRGQGIDRSGSTPPMRSPNSTLGRSISDRRTLSRSSGGRSASGTRSSASSSRSVGRATSRSSRSSASPRGGSSNRSSVGRASGAGRGRGSTGGRMRGSRSSGTGSRSGGGSRGGGQPPPR